MKIHGQSLSVSLSKFLFLQQIGSVGFRDKKLKSFDSTEKEGIYIFVCSFQLIFFFLFLYFFLLFQWHQRASDVTVFF